MAHFNSFVRIPLVVLRQAIKPFPALGALETDTLKLRVWPNDVDFNFHLNNARYLSVMDYGRMRHLARVGLMTQMFKQRWTPVVGAVWMTYRRSLPLWAPYRLTTRLVCWDERWFYFEQIFTGGEGLVAVGWVKAALLDKGAAVAPQRVMDLVQVGIVSPEVPEAIQTLNGLTRGKLQSAAS